MVFLWFCKAVETFVALRWPCCQAVAPAEQPLPLLVLWPPGSWRNRTRQRNVKTTWMGVPAPTKGCLLLKTFKHPFWGVLLEVASSALGCFWVLFGSKPTSGASFLGSSPCSLKQNQQPVSKHCKHTTSCCKDL